MCSAQAVSWNYDSPNKLSWALNCDFTNNDFANAKTNGETCGPRCAQTSGCTHFTWTNYEGGTCWLKKGSVSKSNAFDKYSDNAVCGILDQSTNDGTSGATLNNVLATRHGAYEVGACELPDGNYAVNLPVALGNVDSLAHLKFDPKYCGHVLRIDCGNGPQDIIVTNSNLGGGLDLYGSSWALATNNKPPGETRCSVLLTKRNMFTTNNYECYHATGEVNNNYYRNVGLFNTNDKLVVAAQFKGINGQHRGSNGYWAFDGLGYGYDTVKFIFNDGSSHSVLLRECKDGSRKKYWS